MSFLVFSFKMISKQSLPLNCVASQTSHLLIPSIPAFSPRIFSVDKNCSAKAAALCTEEKARLSIFVFYRRRRKRKSWKKNMFSFSEIGPYRFFSLGGHHESVGDLHPRFTRLTADTSKTFAVTSCRGSPSRKPSRFVASQLHLLRLCISVPFLSILHLSGHPAYVSNQ